MSNVITCAKSTMQPANHHISSPSGSRKRKINQTDWKCNVAKRKCNSGEEYVSVNTGKTVAAKAVGPPCSCSKKCFIQLGNDSISTIHTEFWASGIHDIQTAFIQKHVTEKPVIRHYTGDESKQRQVNRTYWFKVGGNQIHVCKAAFASILGISTARVYRALEKVTASGVPVPDMRGRHLNHPRVSQDRLQLAVDHVNSFPTVTSHYSRNNSPNVRYLETDVRSRAHMYRLYRKWLKANHPGALEVTAHCYDDLLTSEFPNLKLSKPRSDTCKKCDEYNIKLRDVTLPASERQQVLIKKELHLAKADRAYKLAKELVESSNDDTMVICLDLQQVLTTPRIPAGVSFYKRKLHTFNFGISDYKTGAGHMFVWDECTARRGSIEIASCIYKFVTTLVPPTIKKLVIFSDNCPGQNKNYTMILFYLHLIHSRHFDEVTHVFLRTGHTYMPADACFATIENVVRRRQFAYSPDCYIDAIKEARVRDNKFTVTKMTQEDFFDFELLKSGCTKKPNPPPNGIRFSDASYFKVTKDYRVGYELADNYTQLQMGGGYQVRLAKGADGNRANQVFNLNVRPQQKYLNPIPLSQPKLKDLQSLVYELCPVAIVRDYWQKIFSILPVPADNDTNDENADEPLSFSNICADYT